MNEYLSIVIPVYNSERIFPELYRRLIKALENIVDSFEIIAVVDGCRDQSYNVIQALSAKDARIKAIEFSRNFGHQAAITAGLSMASGNMVAIMDDDLEDPPETLPLLVARVREGFDVVYGIRRKRKRALIHRFFFTAFYRILSGLVDVHMPGDAGDFCVMTRRVVNALNAMPENNRYLRGLRAWAGFDQTGIEYERGDRFASESGYNFGKYFKLALDAIFSFSYKPLEYVSKIGFVIALGSFIYGLYVIFIGRILVAPGWSSLFIAILFFSGVQLISIGIIGQYLARIYDEIKQRPKFIIKRTVGFEKEILP
ncbi:MAG: glycosyltransferase family 2 protein [Verrucomicrobia bacterium]|nr:glycosyltransferase family 2 protein [Verrucomicrobiota bacterium]MCG2681956.1 glycosyltransferase family 2 protein [Kiritimatiellia bacterium]MBU4247156.1 glycosyltransferase family 2 protein [Verrucomicrobiota bacterium]MBU4290997.1 glycosyltransferase family 2 protein [Verrucomicrobiota bacterium]MBU4429157.1 glycosyltransferase family 2 protein [Verrucomicrobiota bacterium]